MIIVINVGNISRENMTWLKFSKKNHLIFFISSTFSEEQHHYLTESVTNVPRGWPSLDLEHEKILHMESYQGFFMSRSMQGSARLNCALQCG